MVEHCGRGLLDSASGDVWDDAAHDASNHVADAAAAARAQLSLERRRQRNREAMQRLRERKQQAITELRETAQALAATHARLLEQIEQHRHGALLAGASSPTRQLEEATRRAQALAAANGRLQQIIDERIRWEDHVALLVEYVNKECDGTAAHLPPPSPAFEVNFVAAPRLTEARAMELMLFHHKKRKALKKQWLLTTRAPFTSDFFGWDIRYFPQGRYWYLKFTKLFRNVAAQTVSRRVWNNAQRLVTYRSRLPHQRLVQVINDNAFVMARWTTEKDRIVKRNHVMYLLRFRVEEPDGTTAIGMQTLPEPGEDAADAFDDKLLPGGEDVCLCIKLKPVRDADTGEEHCMAEFSGRTLFGDADYAQMNALEMVLSLARWEEVNVATSPLQLQWS